MSKESHGVIYDEATYTADQIAAVLHRDAEKVKRFIRESGCRYAIVVDTVVVSGRNWRLAVEAVSKPGTENEADTRAKRVKRAIASTNGK